MGNGNRGFSLIELMIALALGLVVTAGIVQLFVGNNQTYTVLQGQSRLQEGARYAMDFIAESSRAAGYFGCDPDADRISHTLKTPDTWANMFEMDITSPVAGFDYTGNGGSGIGDWTPSAAILPRVGAATTSPFPANGLTISDVEPNTDILVLRRIETPGERIAAIVQPTTNPIPIIDDGDNPLAVDDFAVVSNCEQAAVFRVTGVADVGAEINIAWDADSGAGSAVYQNEAGDTLSADFVSYGSTVDPQGTTVSRVTTDIYYIADGSGTNNRGQTPLALWRKSGTDAPVELVEGIRDLQILFGVDTNPGDNIDAPIQYVDFASVNLPDDVIRTLRVQITASTVDVVDEGDAVMTRTFTQTIGLRNAI